MPGPDAGPTSIRPTATPGWSLADLAGRLGLATSMPSVAVTGITHDSVAVRRGDLYAGLPGARAHGAQFAATAVAAGAVAVLTDEAGARVAGAVDAPVLVVDDPRARFGGVASWIYGEPSARLRLLGVTGTNGKTTTTYLLDAGLRATGDTTGLIGTIETRIGDDATPSARTTPEAPELQALFAVMAERGIGSAAMEVSSHALALHRVDGTSFDVVAFTNLSQDHLDFHADLDDYFAAKARLFTAAFARHGVVNVDDAHGRRLLRNAEIELTTVSSQQADADWRARDINSDLTGSRFVVDGPGVELSLHVQLAGAFNVANALLALATLVTAGVEPDVAAAGIGELATVPGRLEAVSVGQPFVAVVDYAHTPEAVVTLLTTLRAATTGRLIVVLGCGGDRDSTKRPLMGAAAARLADVAVLTSDNPRSEDPAQIVAAMFEGAMGVASAQRAQVLVELDRRTAIAMAVEQARPGDVLVVAGKGHEQGQDIAGVVEPFDDRVVLRSQLVELAAAGGVA